MPMYKPLLTAATHLTRRAAKRRMSIISSILLISLLFPITLYLLLGNILVNDPRLVPHAIRNAQNVLFITAHPDDGALFFGPSILQSLGRKNVNRYLLVLSSGVKHPETHKLETKSFCLEYSIPDKRCLILQNKDLQFSKKWDESIIQRILERHIRKWEIDLIITFDADGFGDENHRALSNAVQRYSTVHDHHNPTAFGDDFATVWDQDFGGVGFCSAGGVSDPLDGKRVGVQPPPKNGDAYGDKALIVADWSGHGKAQAALKKHTSAYSWDRALYSSLSRYMWFNDLRRM
uniref:N-acetylglucosaminylphosphatidylinositol deacetylase n=1 Tax=Talaromyces marneffei PM1 TaxID=1077442 RepID=A0A093VR00_TALMA